RVSLWAGATVGASGGEPPPYYQFFLGGANTYYVFPDRDIAFVGLRTQQRRGRHVQKAELGAQWELWPDVFARVRWNAGTVLHRHVDAPVHGYARVQQVVRPRDRHRETLQRDLGGQRALVSRLYQLAHANRAHVAEHQLRLSRGREHADADIGQVGPDLLAV